MAEGEGLEEGLPHGEAGSEPSDDSLYREYLAVHTLKEVGPSLSDHEFNQKLQQLAPRVTRCRRAGPGDAPSQLLRRILKLPEEEIYEALCWRETPFTYTEDEQIYKELGGWLGRYLRWARTGNAPLGFHLWSALGALGAACQRRVFVPAGRRIYMNLYVIFGAVRSAGKGQGFEPAIRMLETTNDYLQERWDEEAPERVINILPPDVTMESLVTELAKKVNAVVTQDPKTGKYTIRETKIDATGLIPLDEMATFFGRDTWAMSRKSPFLNTMKEADKYRKATKRSGEEVLENCALSMIACCAPDFLRDTIDTSLLGGGFMDRCVWIYRDPNWERREAFSIVNSPPKDPLQMRLLAEWVAENISGLTTKQPALLSPTVKGKIHGIYQRAVREEKRQFELYGTDAKEKTANRMTWLLMQVATLMAVSDGSIPPVRLKPEHIDLAEAIIRMEDASMTYFLEEGGRSKTQYWDQRLLAFLEECGGCSKRGLMNQTFRRHFDTTKEINTVVRNLMDTDQIEEHQIGNARFLRVKGHRCGKCDTVGGQ